MKEAKASSESRVTMAQLVQPNQANPFGNMHGGEVIKLMDSAAGVVAQRHSRHNVVTAVVDRLFFKEPIFVGDLIFCHAELIYTGTSSMEIFVTVEVENMDRGEKKLALEGYFLMIALDRNGRSTPVPPLKIETEAQAQRFEECKQRIMQARNQRER